MASSVGICNSALVKIGADRIMSLTEDSKNAHLCNEQFAKLRDEVLRAHKWNFAVARTSLARLSDAPAFGFARAYQLPTDWLRTISVHANGNGGPLTRYAAEGRRILTDSVSVYLRYVRQVTDPNQFDSLFQEGLSYRLAAELALPIAQSNSLKQMMEEKYDEALRRARGVDSQDDFPEESPAGSWTEARR